jgi:iron complex outermembrane receptor protein
LGFNVFGRQPDNLTGDTFWINAFNPEYGNIPDEEFLLSNYAENPDDEIEDFGIYLSDQISLGSWRVTLGARYDEVENNSGLELQEDDQVSYSLGALYQFDNGFAPYASYSQSFEPVIGDNGRGEALDPREGEQIEVGIKYQPDDFPALVTLAYFELEESNLPDPESNPSEFRQQSGKAHIDGIEFQAQALLGDFIVDLALTWLDTEGPNGFRLDTVPEEQASLWTTWNPGGKLVNFRAGAGIRYLDKRWDGRDEFHTDASTIGDLMLGYQFENWDLSVNAQNVTDEDGFASCLTRGDCFPQSERTIVGRMRYSFD